MRLVRLTAAVAVLSLAVLPVLAGIDSRTLNQAAKLYQKGERALSAGRLVKAREAFEASLARIPDFPDAHMGLGQLDMHAERYERALRHFEQARDGFRGLGEALMQIRMRRYTSAQNDIADLRDSIRELTGTNSNASPATVNLQVSQLQNQIDRLEAIAPPDEDKLGEPPGEIYFYIGNALFQLGRIDEALSSWETCRATTPKFPMVHNNLALAYWRQGRVEDARASLARAEELGFDVNAQFKADLEAASR